jgi:hypothetical protein
LQGFRGLQGDRGTYGTRGTTGDKGLQGFNGVQGERGTYGVRGTQGTAGPQGFQGVTSTQMGTYGMRGTQGTAGPQGFRGTQGDMGTYGTRGTQGTAGPQGFKGATGSTGTYGDRGGNGSTGLQGFQGAQGDNGTYGSRGTTGVRGSSGSIASISVTSSATGYLIGKKDSTANWEGTFYVASNVYFQNGNLYANSDEKLKNIKDNIKVDFDELAKIRKVYYTFKDDETKTVQIGTIAQDIQKYYPEAVALSVDNTLSVAYDRLSIIALAAIDELHKRVKTLEEKIK